MLGRIAIPEDDFSAPPKSVSRRFDRARAEAVRDTIAANPGITPLSLCHALGIDGGTIDSILRTVENNYMLLSEDENGGLHLYGRI